MNRQLLQQALDALEESVDLVQHDYDADWRHGMPTRKAQLDASLNALTAHRATITALREALAAPEPEPEPLTIDQEKALSAKAKTGPFQHTTPVVGNDMQSGETPRLSGNRHAGSTPPAAPAPEGWVMVPREPTPEMIAAMPYPANTIPAVGVECYRAMIAAAPAAPVVPNGCEKIFTHKWLDPNCIEQGCKSLAAPVVPLTDEQILSMWRSSKFRGNGGQADWFCEGIRAAEAHHGITGASK